jgi:hypothetical protein
MSFSAFLPREWIQVDNEEAKAVLPFTARVTRLSSLRASTAAR